MTDLALSWKNGNGDVISFEGALQQDESLTTAIIISLFTDLRVNDQRGWWGNSFTEPEFPLGSKLWTLSREKQLPDVLEDIENYAYQALNWLLQDKKVTQIQVQASNPQTMLLWLDIQLHLPDGSQIQRTFSASWSM